MGFPLGGALHVNYIVACSKEITIFPKANLSPQGSSFTLQGFFIQQYLPDVHFTITFSILSKDDTWTIAKQDIVISIFI